MSDHDACGNGFKLSLSLFDTSNPNEDVVIEKLLVDAGKAVYLCVWTTGLGTDKNKLRYVMPWWEQN